MDKPQPTYHAYDDEITLKELILKLQEFWRELRRNQVIVLFSGLICAALVTAWNLRKPTTYRSAMTFMVGEVGNKKESLLLTPFDQVQFDGVKNHKLTVIARSSKIVHKVLLDTSKAFRSNFGEKLVEVYSLQDDWNDYNWEEVDLSTMSAINSSEENKKIFNKLHEKLVGNKLNKNIDNPLMSISYDDETELFKMSITSINKDFSSNLLNCFYSNISEFYIDKTIGKPKRTYNKLKTAEDSLRLKLNDAESILAYSTDRSRGVVSSVAKVNIGRLSRNLTNISSQYEEIRANRQKIEYMLQTETPDFQIIDQTFVPIKEKQSTIRLGLFGMFLGGLISASYIFFRYLILKSMDIL